jgi:hypothetical protein
MLCPFPWFIMHINRIYNYLCNQCLSPLILWVRFSIRARCTTLCDKVCQWLATGRWFSPGPPVSCTNKTDRHDITEILLKVALNTIEKKAKKKQKQAYVNWNGKPQFRKSSSIFEIISFSIFMVNYKILRHITIYAFKYFELWKMKA